MLPFHCFNRYRRCVSDEEKGRRNGGTGGDDAVDGVDDPVKGGVRSDGHVGAAEVVVDGADHADDVEVDVLGGLNGSYLGTIS